MSMDILAKQAQLAAAQESKQPETNKLGMYDLSGAIDVNHSTVLNHDKRTHLKSILGKGRKGMLKSDFDVDHQLLIHIKFQTAVKIHDMFVTAQEGKFQAEHKSEDDPTESGPKILKLFVDQPNLDFSEAEDAVPTQEFDLSVDQLDGSKIPLKFVKFQNVHCLSLFIEDNQDDTDVTFLNNIFFEGKTIAGFDMNNLKKVGWS